MILNELAAIICLIYLEYMRAFERLSESERDALEQWIDDSTDISVVNTTVSEDQISASSSAASSASAAAPALPKEPESVTSSFLQVVISILSLLLLVTESELSLFA